MVAAVTTEASLAGAVPRADLDKGVRGPADAVTGAVVELLRTQGLLNITSLTRPEGRHAVASGRVTRHITETVAGTVVGARVG